MIAEDVFTLGYPLVNTMGSEIKLATGLISANTGFENRSTDFTISTPIQPGNSGGPLFTRDGLVIGVVNAKHSKTDNVSYAIKSSILINFLKPFNSKISYPKSNLLRSSSLKQQVNKIKPNIVLIKTK